MSDILRYPFGNQHDARFFERPRQSGNMANVVADQNYAAALVQKALGERALSEATALTVSGHWQSLQSLGDSLHGCTSLTELDLSRNCLSSLDGMQSLHRLRTLNLYFNCVSSLCEVQKLRCNPVLEVLDLRLNPVTHAGRRHRLRALRTVPSLTRLDGREVSAAERAQPLAAICDDDDDDESDVEVEFDEMSPLPPARGSASAGHLLATHAAFAAESEGALAAATAAVSLTGCSNSLRLLALQRQGAVDQAVEVAMAEAWGAVQAANQAAAAAEAELQAELEARQLMDLEAAARAGLVAAAQAQAQAQALQ